LKKLSISLASRIQQENQGIEVLKSSITKDSVLIKRRTHILSQLIKHQEKLTSYFQKLSQGIRLYGVIIDLHSYHAHIAISTNPVPVIRQAKKSSVISNASEYSWISEDGRESDSETLIIFGCGAHHFSQSQQLQQSHVIQSSCLAPAIGLSCPLKSTDFSEIEKVNSKRVNTEVQESSSDHPSLVGHLIPKIR
jgi:hypothetical protein